MQYSIDIKIGEKSIILWLLKTLTFNCNVIKLLVKQFQKIYLQKNFYLWIVNINREFD